MDSSTRRRERWRWVIAGLAIAGATAVMWSDASVEIWQDLVALALTFNREATATIMGARQWGDADLHVALWGSCTLVVLWACRTRRQVLVAIVALLIWSGFTELAQPWVTQIRTRQVVDFAGNVLGVSLGALAFALVHWLRGVRQRRMLRKPAHPGARTG